jgi:Cu2+-exporting ATPase
MNAAAPALADPLALLDDPIEQARFTRRGGDGSAESALQLSGLHCAACAETIESALRRVPGVLDARVSAAASRANVRWDPARTRVSALVAAITQAGYGALPDVAASARVLRQAEARAALWRLFVAAFCAMQVMMLATPAYVAGAGELQPDLKQLLDWGSWLLSLPVLLFSATPFFAGAWRALRRRRIGMDVPVALGIVVTFVASTGATFVPGGPFGHEVYFDSLTMFVAFLLGGRWLQLRMRHRAADALDAALARLPQTAWRLREGDAIEVVSALRLQPGDRVRVPLGQAFPADGVLIDGATQADEALLTGEARPCPKRPGDAVVAGSINLGAPAVVRVERVGADTRAERIAALVDDAMSQRPAAAASADRWAAPFLWAVLLLAAGAAAVWSVLDPPRALWVAVSVLIVTCPCALSLAVPSALLAAARRLAAGGVLLQRLDALDALADVQRLFIDKTGTLTQPQAQVHGMQGETNEAWREAAASLAAWSTHPLAQAIAALGVGEPRTHWQSVVEHPGLGLMARDGAGVDWRLGAPAWAGAPAADGGGPEVWLARAGVPLARFVIDEALRDDAAQAVAALRAAGVKVELLSGDRPARVRSLARRLALDGARGGATPSDKLAAVRAAQARGERVAMVGDGVNDAPVLAQADASFAMGQGALAARASADAVVLSMRLGDVAQALTLARRTRRIVRQNIAWAAAYNAACIPLALAGWLPPWAAGLGMALSSLLVIGNALRLAR